jgi:CheY-specific phosphatase CheX
MRVLDIYQEHVPQIAADVFGSMLAMSVWPVEAVSRPIADALTATVRFEGAWSGVLDLECSPLLAMDLALRLLPYLQENPEQEFVLDALGEVANVMGGNLKAVLPRGVEVSMPTVSAGPVNRMKVSDQDRVSVRFSSGQNEFAISLTEFRT